MIEEKKKQAKMTAKDRKAEFAARMMYQTTLQVVDLIKKVGRKLKLQQCENDEMICGALVQYVVDGGITDKEVIRTRTLELIGMVDEICRDVFDVKLADNDCYTSSEKGS